MSTDLNVMGGVLSSHSPEEEKLIEKEDKEIEVSTVRTDERIIFLPLTYFLSNRFDKHVTACIIDNAVGLFFSGCPQKRVVLSYYVWNTLNVYVDHIQLALNNRKKIRFTLKDITDGVDQSSVCVIKPIFGRWIVQIINLSGEKICLSSEEWKKFIGYLPSLSRHIMQLWRDEPEILKVISEGDSPTTHWWSDRLSDELKSVVEVQSNS
jgi:hypothetical protein